MAKSFLRYFFVLIILAAQSARAVDLPEPAVGNPPETSSSQLQSAAPASSEDGDEDDEGPDCKESLKEEAGQYVAGARYHLIKTCSDENATAGAVLTMFGGGGAVSKLANDFKYNFDRAVKSMRYMCKATLKADAHNTSAAQSAGQGASEATATTSLGASTGNIFGRALASVRMSIAPLETCRNQLAPEAKQYIDWMRSHLNSISAAATPEKAGQCADQVRAYMGVVDKLEEDFGELAGKCDSDLAGAYAAAGATESAVQASRAVASGGGGVSGKVPRPQEQESQPTSSKNPDSYDSTPPLDNSDEVKQTQEQLKNSFNETAYEKVEEMVKGPPLPGTTLTQESINSLRGSPPAKDRFKDAYRDYVESSLAPSSVGSKSAKPVGGDSDRAEPAISGNRTY